jgi:beta-N-acetylhexosaminidase
MYSLGSTNDAELAQEVGRVMAEEMRAIGINVDFAPDVDVFSNPNNNVIGKRSFSDNPQVVTKMSMALARGLEENGVVATYKHFPGHGDTAVDSHLSLPIINRSRDELERSDLIPFRNAIENGAKIIMVGHIALPKVTGDNTPASLSGTIITDILRREYKYDGLVVTDAMNMGAITNNYQEWDSYRRAINAGADMLVLPSNPELAIESIKRNVKIERIDEAAYRVLKFKKENLEDYEYLDESYFGSAEHAEVIQRIR